MKQKYIICYDKDVPFLSIPVYEDIPDVETIRDNYYLNDSIIIKIETSDKFIGW